MTIYKTTTGLTRAVESTISDLDGFAPQSDREYQAMDNRVARLLRQCRGIWRNPADESEFGRLADRLRDSWNRIHAI